MNNEFLPAYKVYQQVIDLELYYAFVDLVVHTSQEEKAWEIYRNIVDTQIWQQKEEEQNYFEAITSVTPARSWNGLKRSWEKMSALFVRWRWRWGKPVRFSQTICLLEISAAVFSRRSGGLPMEMCTCKGRFICWKQICPADTPCWMNWLPQNMPRPRMPCLSCLCSMTRRKGTALCTANFSDCWGMNARFPYLKTVVCWNGWSSIMLRISSRIAESQILFCEH